MSNYSFNYNQYKKRITKSSQMPFSVIFLLIIVLLGVACFIGNPKKRIETFYFLEVDCFFNYSDANACANEISALNAGGYVYFNGKYHVLACAYLNEADANKAKENIKQEYPNAQVFTLSTHKFNENNFTEKEVDEISTVINANYETIKNIYNLIIRCDTNTINENEIERELENLNKNYSNKVDGFKTLFRNNKKFTKEKELVSKFSSCLAQNSSLTNISQSLKYNLIKISILHYSFLECFC